MNEGERAIIKEIANEVGEVLMKRFEKKIAEEIEHHKLTCSAISEVSKWRGQAKMLLVGVAIGAAIVGSFGTVSLLKVFKFF